MAGFIRSVVKFLALLITVPIDVLLRRRQKTYVASVLINAPRKTVFDILRAPRQKFTGVVEMDIAQTLEDPERGIHKATYNMADQTFVARFREREIVSDELIVTEFLTEGSDKQIVPGNNYVIATALEEADGVTRLTGTFSIEHTTLMSRFTIPLMARPNLRMIGNAAEEAAGRSSIDAPSSPIGNAVITGLVTLASFAVIFGLEFAALLIIVLLLHELGHVAAMRWCGVPVRGIYFIPFMGAVAVGTQGFGDEGRRGFIALMGPALSLVPTALFITMAASGAAFDYADGRDLWRDLAFVSVFLNLFNLFPFLPLDGGQIIGALLSRTDVEVRRVVQLIFLTLASAAAVYLQSYILLAIFLVVGLSLVMQSPSETRMKPATVSEIVWLLIAYVATCASYVTLFMTMSLRGLAS